MNGRTGVGGARDFPQGQEPGEMIGSRPADLIEANGR